MANCKVTILFLAAVLSIAACSPDSGSSSSDEDVSLPGFWRVSISGSGAYDVVIDDDHRFMAFDGDISLVGTSADSIYQAGSTVYAVGDACSMSQELCWTVSFQFDVDSATSLSGHAEDYAGTYDATARKTTTMDRERTVADLIDKTWVNTSDNTATLVFYSDGSFQGTYTTGSPNSGTFEDTGKNAFVFSVTGPIDGATYTIPGLAYLDSNGRLVTAGTLKSGDSYLFVSGIATAQ